MIIGQEKLVSNISRVLDIFKKTKAQIRPHFILTGQSGTGKSFTIKMLCQQKKIEYFEINGAAITKEGTSGNSLSKALSPLLNRTSDLPIVVFVDEFDKLFVSGNTNNEIAHETTLGVQNEFLKVLESESASVFGDYGKYINIPINNTLFIFAGAFNGEEGITLDRLRELGIKTEFLGRVGLVFSTTKLSLESLFEMLEKDELLANYLELFTNADREHVILTLKGAIQRNYENNTLGARMIKTLIHQYFITGGKLSDNEEKKSTFQDKIEL
jgi:ATP-dependent protease Clp ATPase subunit